MSKRVLVACEESQAVTSELRRGGLKLIAAIYCQLPADTQSGTYKQTRWKSAKCNGIWF